MGETGKEEYKIQSFDSETQKLLKTALKGQRVLLPLCHPQRGWQVTLGASTPLRSTHCSVWKRCSPDASIRDRVLLLNLLGEDLCSLPLPAPSHLLLNV